MINKKIKLKKKYVCLLIILFIILLISYINIFEQEVVKNEKVLASDNENIEEKKEIKVNDNITKVISNDIPEINEEPTKTNNSLYEEKELLLKQKEEITKLTRNTIIDNDNTEQIDTQKYDITTNIGKIIPEFDMDVTEYEIILSENEDISNINLKVIGVNEDSIKYKEEKIGMNQVREIITLKSDDIKEINYIFNIYQNQRTIEKIELSTNELYIDLDDKIRLEYTTEPDNVDKEKIQLIVEDESIIKIDENNVISCINYGSTNITLLSITNPEISSKLNVNVINGKIRSNEYEIKRLKDNYIIIYDSEITISEFLNKINNNKDNIKIYDNDEMITNYNTFIKNGLKITLNNNGIIDEAYIVIKGDLSPDGMILMNDLNQLKRYLNNEIEFTLIDQIAADINDDQVISYEDKDILYDYISGKIISLKQ